MGKTYLNGNSGKMILNGVVYGNNIEGGGGTIDTSKLCYSYGNLSFINQGRYVNTTNGYGISCLVPISDTTTTYGPALMNPFYHYSKFKISIRFMRFGNQNSQMLMGDSQSSRYGALPGIEIMSNNCIGVGYGSRWNGWDGWISLNTVIQTNIYYVVQFEWDGAKVYLRLFNEDGTTMIEEQVQNFTSKPVADSSSANPSIGGFGYDRNGHIPYNVLFDLLNIFLSRDNELFWGCNELGLEE